MERDMSSGYYIDENAIDLSPIRPIILPGLQPLSSDIPHPMGVLFSVVLATARPDRFSATVPANGVLIEVKSSALLMYKVMPYSET